jgi:hemerythrin
MQLFQWDKTLETGNHDIDEQHQHLVGIINEFGELMEREAAGREDIELVCAKLAEYASSHFDLEEKLMEQYDLDQRHRYQHRHQHEDLIYETELSRHVLAAGADPAAGRIFFEFLTNWLVFHVIGTDMLMARQILAIRQGKTGAEAYLSEEQEIRNSTGLLLRAVKNLLSQISSRNKQLVELNETLERRVRERTTDLTTANQKLHALVSTDDLTGTLSRRAFMEEAGNLVQLAQRYKHSLSLLMIDVDHFKKVNDTYGHQTGDRVLAHLSKVMQDCLRGTDRFGRVGGEEFAVILPETDLEQTALLIERLLYTVRNATVEIGESSPLRVTVSIGVATLSPAINDIDALMKMADQALYQAKSAGRDRWCTVS